MWVARDKNKALSLFENKPERYDETWCQSDEYLCSTMDLNISLFSELKWEDEPIEVELTEIIDKSNPTKFESCGNHLRNLLGPYQTLVDVIKLYQEGKCDIEFLKEYIKNRNFQEGVDNIIKFSENDKLENVNWR